MSHDHAHHHAHGDATRFALLVALALNGAFLVIEAVAGWWTGSLALLSDAAHMVGDVGAIALALTASHLARRAATPNRSFGLVRAEVLGAFVNGIALLVAVGFILEAAIGRLVGGPPHVEALPVLLVGIGGLAVNLGSAWYLYRANSENLNVRGALLHMLADALGSVGAIVAAILLAAGLPAADAVVSLIIAALVLVSTWSLLRESTRILLQFAPPNVNARDVEAALRTLEGVTLVHDLHIWTVDGQNAVLTAHLLVPDPDCVFTVRARAEALLRERFGVRHTTLQVDVGDDAPRPRCALTDEHEHAHAHA